MIKVVLAAAVLASFAGAVHAEKIEMASDPMVIFDGTQPSNHSSGGIALKASPAPEINAVKSQPNLSIPAPVVPAAKKAKGYNAFKLSAESVVGSVIGIGIAYGIGTASGWSMGAILIIGGLLGTIVSVVLSAN